MDFNTILRWLSEHWPSLVSNGGLAIVVFRFYLDNKKLRSELRHTDAQTANEETDNLAKQVGGVVSVIAVYKDAQRDVVEKLQDSRDEVKSLRGQLKRRDAHVVDLQQQIEILREMRSLPPEETA